MGRQVGCTGLVRIGELLGEDREEEERDDDRKDIFWGIKEDEVVDHLLRVYYRFHSFLLRSVRVGTIVDLETRDCRLRVLLINGTSREETTGDRDESYG